ncbi:MAG: zinc dependent phospholipase C family protein, partial [Bacteroidota bacterium]
FFTAKPAFGWGFWAHQRINRMAVFTLPPEMLGLYKRHIAYLTAHAVDPDKRRYAIDGEAPRHYIDIDHYGQMPFDNVPRRWYDAVEALSEDTLMAYGIVPYHLVNGWYDLKSAFEARDIPRIMKLSADLGHYIGDAHVPLHTTENYNGQLTGQKGIHGFWESRLPELFGTNYDYLAGRAYYIEDIVQEGWDAVLESHQALDSVLYLEKRLSQRFPDDRRYGYETRGAATMRVYARPYAEAYHRALDGMVERRMRKAIRRVGAYWYSAWKAAGSPELDELLDIPLDAPDEKWEKRLQIIDRESQDLGMLPPTPIRDYCCTKPQARPMGWPRANINSVASPKSTGSWWDNMWKESGSGFMPIKERVKNNLPKLRRGFALDQGRKTAFGGSNSET